MRKTIKISLSVASLLLLSVHPVLAANADNITGLSTQVVFIITIIVSIIFGLILTRVAAENRQAKGRMFATKAKGRGELDPNEVLQELKGLSGSAKRDFQSSGPFAGIKYLDILSSPLPMNLPVSYLT